MELHIYWPISWKRYGIDENDLHRICDGITSRKSRTVSNRCLKQLVRRVNCTSPPWSGILWETRENFAGFYLGPHDRVGRYAIWKIEFWLEESSQKFMQVLWEYVFFAIAVINLCFQWPSHWDDWVGCRWSWRVSEWGIWDASQSTQDDPDSGSTHHPSERTTQYTQVSLVKC